MKKLLFLSIIVLAASFSYAQNNSTLTLDEQLRLKQSVHLITYDTVGNFESAVGEAYYFIVLNAFRDGLVIPTINNVELTPKDKAKIDDLIIKLNALLKAPPSWEEILVGETKYMLFKDKSLRRVTKYKVQ